MIPLLDTIAGLLKTGLDKWIPDANTRELVAVELAKQAYKELELELQDRASARAREMAVRDYTPAVLAYGITLGFFGILSWMMTHELPVAGHDVLLVMLGALGGAWGAVVSYYFGSSKGSEDKTKLLANGRK